MRLCELNGRGRLVTEEDGMMGLSLGTNAHTNFCELATRAVDLASSTDFSKAGEDHLKDLQLRSLYSVFIDQSKGSLQHRVSELTSLL